MMIIFWNLEYACDCDVADGAIKLNANGGLYEHGKSYEYYTKKIQVAIMYKMKSDELGGGHPSINKIARRSQVGWHFVEKFEKEIIEHERVFRQCEFFAKRSANREHHQEQRHSMILTLLYSCFYSWKNQVGN